MANFNHKAFIKHDDYMTPKHCWVDIKQYIPTDKTILEPFFGDGKSGQYLNELGFDVRHEPKDFFDYDIEESVVVSNPPFSKIPDILTTLVMRNRPFILIMPCSKMNTQYFRKIFIDIEKPQIIIPKKRIQFIKNGVDKKGGCSFDCYYYCWKIGLKRDIIWLD